MLAPSSSAAAGRVEAARPLSTLRSPSSLSTAWQRPVCSFQGAAPTSYTIGWTAHRPLLLLSRSASSPAHADAKSLSAGCKGSGMSTPQSTNAGRCPSPAGIDEAGPERSPPRAKDPRLLERGRGEERERRRTELPPDEHPADLLRACAHLVQEGVAQEAVDLVVVRVAVAAARRRLVSPDLKTRSSEAEEERRTHPSIWSASRQTSVARSDE